MRIGELSERAGVSTDTIRFYERVGVIAPPRRTASGYRDYDHGALDELNFIRAAQAIGLTLHELAEIVAFRDRDHTPCDELVALMERHLAGVEQRLGELERMRVDLIALLAAARSFEDCTPDTVYRLVVPPTP